MTCWLFFKIYLFFNNHVRPHKQYLRLNLIVHLSSINLRNLHAITYRSCRLLYCRLKLHSAQCFPWHRFLPSLSGGRSSLLVHVALSSVIFSWHRPLSSHLQNAGVKWILPFKKSTQLS